MKRVSFAILAVVLACANDARADEASSAAAQSLFQEGRALLQQGRFAEACDRLARSDRLDPAVGTRLSLGDCHERLGHTASAWAAYSDASALAIQRSDTARADFAKKHADALEPKLARLTIRVTPGTRDVAVTRNGTRVDPAALETAIPVDAGDQAIEATAPGHRAWRTTLAMKDRDVREVRVPVLDAEPTAAPVEPAPVVVDSSDSRRTLALGLEIGGGVALVGGLVFGGLAMSKWSSVEDTCPDGHCATNADRDRLAPDVSTARTLAVASTVTMALGAVALGAGIVLHLTAAPQRVAIVPIVDPKSAGVAGTVSF